MPVLPPPPPFGAGPIASPSATSGSSYGANGSITSLRVPAGYLSGAPLGAASMTFATKTFSTLGMTPGTHIWPWSAGTFTLQIGPPPAVPAASPVGLALLIFLALAGLAYSFRRQRRWVG